MSNRTNAENTPLYTPANPARYKTFSSCAALKRAVNLILIVQSILIVTLIALVCFGPIHSPDFWWQLAEGREILAGGSIDSNPPRAFGLPSYANDYVVYDSIIALAYATVGMDGLRLFFGFLNFLPFALTAYVWLGRHNTLCVSYQLVGIIAFGFLFVRLQQRPEIVGNGLLVGLGLILLGAPTAQLSRMHYTVIAAILCVWSNFHTSFIVGLGMLGLWSLEVLWRHRWSHDFRQVLYCTLKLITAGLVGAILNLDGVSRLWAPLLLQTSFWSVAVTPEMWPLKLHFYPWLLSGVVIGGCFWYSSRAQTRPLWLFLLFVITVLLALTSNRHINLVGCALLLLLGFRLKYDPLVARPELSRRWALICQALISFVLIALTASLIVQHGSQELKRWKMEEWAISNRAYASAAMLELHRREPDGTSFLTGMFDGAYAYSMPEYNLRPLIDTGLSRFSTETVKYFFQIDNQPRALRFVLDQLKSNYAVVSLHNSHWAAVLNNAPGWSLSFVSEKGLVYQRQANRVETSDRLRNVLQMTLSQVHEKEKTAAGIYYTMGLLSPDTTLELLSNSPAPWWKEPGINFLLEWLNGVPAVTIKNSIAKLSVEKPAHLRLRILLALQLGASEEAEHLSRALELRELEDAVLRVEVLLSTTQQCAAQEVLKGIFPPRGWSVRLAGVVHRMQHICGTKSAEFSVSSRMNELVWSDEMESWMREISFQLNQNIALRAGQSTARVTPVYSK